MRSRQEPLFQVGRMINDYKFEKFLGSGGFGQVWMAAFKSQKYAVKIMDYNQKTSQAEQDLANGERISCPFLMNYISSFRDSSFPEKVFVVLEYCSRGNLQSLFDDMSGFGLSIDLDHTMKLFIQMTIALFEIHGRGIFHRDIKPENVLLDANYDAKLGDFGLSRRMDNSRQLATSVLGTPKYMAPEMWRGQYDEKADIFALGLMTFELCAKDMPYEDIEDLSLRKFKPFPEEENFPTEFCDLIYSMFDPKPTNRPSAKQILENPLIQEYAARLSFRKDYLISQFHPDVKKVASFEKSKTLPESTTDRKSVV